MLAYNHSQAVAEIQYAQVSADDAVEIVHEQYYYAVIEPVKVHGY